MKYINQFYTAIALNIINIFLLIQFDYIRGSYKNVFY